MRSIVAICARKETSRSAKHNPDVWSIRERWERGRFVNARRGGSGDGQGESGKGVEEVCVGRGEARNG
jgi:hypothetical protein